MPLDMDTTGAQASSSRARWLANMLTGTSNERAGKYRRTIGLPRAFSSVLIKSFKLVPTPELMLKTRCGPM